MLLRDAYVLLSKDISGLMNAQTSGAVSSFISTSSATVGAPLVTVSAIARASVNCLG